MFFKMFIKTCELCGKACPSQRSLKDHRLKVHPKTRFHCYHCQHVSKTKQQLSSHVKVHLKTVIRGDRFSCPMCSHVACNRKSMVRHYVEEHDVSLTPEEFEFKTYSEFLAWKSSLVKTEHCTYVTDGGPTRTTNLIFRNFRCFRDGFYFSKGKGKRRMKVRGSCKINGICPSKISCSENRQSGVVSVSYIVAHVGHEMDVGRLTLTKEEKDAIAHRIAAKVPFDVILDGLRDSGTKTVERSNLVTRKDLRNIERDYNLNTRHDRAETPALVGK